jgi:tetratricopeptide (TPR) repeat protein
MRTLSLLLLAVVASLSWAQADDTSVSADAHIAYREGHFAEAMQRAEQENTAPALAFAARACIADAITRPEGFCADCLRQAQRLASRAAKIDPNHVEAYLQDAIALGFLGRVMGVQAARREGLAEKVRARLDTALTIDPGNPWAEASLGAWHLEIVSQAGPWLASLLYGADEKEGLSLYRKALRAAPDAPILHYQFALALLARDGDRYALEARQALQRVQSAQEPDALMRFTAKRARLLLDAMGTADRRTLLQLVRSFQGYAPPPAEAR